MKRPNIYIFNPDQFRADSLRHLSNIASRTDYLDKMVAKEAVSFSRAFCQNPVCVPSRCSFSTGLYPHTRGHRTMEFLLGEGESTIFKELKDSGYKVWMNARNDLIAGQVEGLIEEHASEIYYGGNKAKQASFEDPTYSIPGNRGYYSMYKGKVKLDDDGKYYSQDDEDVDAALEYIKNNKGDDPICVFLGLFNPHPPYQVEEPYFSAIDREKLPQRISADKGVNKAKILSMIRENQDLEELTEDEWSELRACYLGMCMKVDSMFERFCEGLKAIGEYDNSLILFFSDHGDYTGDYGIAEKAQNTFEDCLVNVPFIIKPPKIEHVDCGVSDSMIELIDLYATLQDYAELEPSYVHFSKSLRPCLENREQIIRDYVFCEGGRLPEEIHCDEFHTFGPDGPNKFFPYWPRLKAQSDHQAHSKGAMIRSEKYKYISRVSGEDELYDLENDSDECINVINKAEYKDITCELQNQLMRWMLRTGDFVPVNHDDRFNFQMKWAKLKQYVPSGYEEEYKMKIRNGINVFLLMQECQKRFKVNEGEE